MVLLPRKRTRTGFPSIIHRHRSRPPATPRDGERSPAESRCKPRPVDLCWQDQRLDNTLTSVLLPRFELVLPGVFQDPLRRIPVNTPVSRRISSGLATRQRRHRNRTCRAILQSAGAPHSWTIPLFYRDLPPTVASPLKSDEACAANRSSACGMSTRMRADNSSGFSADRNSRR